MALFSGWNDLLRVLRERQPGSVTQASAGASVGRSGKQIHMYEHATTEPQIGMFARLLELYGVRDLLRLQDEFDQLRGDAPRRPRLSPGDEARKMLATPEPWQLQAMQTMGERLSEYQDEVSLLHAENRRLQEENAQLRAVVERGKT